MQKWNYTKGLHDIGNGIYAYLLPNGSWGWSNAGLIKDGEQSLLVDTLFDEILTAEMLKSMEDHAGIRKTDITTVVNTHANGDHTFGNRLVRHAEIIASKASVEEMDDFTPATAAEMMKKAPTMGIAGEFLLRHFSPFHFEGIELTKPTRTFSGELKLKVGDKNVHMIEVGPAHTRGDVLVYVPSDKVVFTGDILFINGTPIIWAGPVSNWIKACDMMLGMDIEVVVPGHGPITDKSGVKQVRDYLVFIDQEARQRYDAGMGFEEAAGDIALNEFGKWTDIERIVVNVFTLFNEYSGNPIPPDYVSLFGLMGKYEATHCKSCHEKS